MHNKNILLVAVFFASVLFFGAGCAAYQQQPPALINEVPPATNQEPPASQPSAETTTNVYISNFTFDPQTLIVTPGTTVVWKNQDGAPHSILSQGNFESADLNRGDEFKFTFSTPGAFDYICKIHPSMRGKIIVKP